MRLPLYVLGTYPQLIIVVYISSGKDSRPYSRGITARTPWLSSYVHKQCSFRIQHPDAERKGNGSGSDIPAP